MYVNNTQSQYTFYNLSNINSILAVIYLTKLQNLINRPVMNCSMSIFPYFYFSNINSILAVIYVNKQVSETD
jgi:hypothetical protein